MRLGVGVLGDNLEIDEDDDKDREVDIGGRED